MSPPIPSPRCPPKPGKALRVLALSLAFLSALGASGAAPTTQTGAGEIRPRDPVAGYGPAGRFSISGNVAAGQNLSPQGTPPATASTPGPGTAAPFETATPQADGSIIHVVETGQTLIGIAAGYGMPLADLLALNDLTETTWIFPGDTLLIQPAHTPTPTASPTATPTRLPPTRRPTFTPTQGTPAALAQAAATDTPVADPTSATLAELDLDSGRSPLVVGIVLGAFLILMAPIIAALRRRR